MSNNKWWYTKSIIEKKNEQFDKDLDTKKAEDLKNKIKTMKWNELKPISVDKIVSEDFPDHKYYPIECPKKQLILHHTVSNPNDAMGDIRWWTKDEKKIATCVIITGDGVPHQMFSSKYWSHHIGIPSSFIKELGFVDWSSRNVLLNQESIAIELDNWGGLTKVSDGVYRNGYNMDLKIPDTDVQYFPDGFRGYKYFQKYTEAQIQTVGELLLFWGKKYGIPLDYHEDMWDISKKAIGGEKGVWAHVSYRAHGDKQDAFPQTELIDMLKTLKSIS